MNVEAVDTPLNEKNPQNTRDSFSTVFSYLFSLIL